MTTLPLVFNALCHGLWNINESRANPVVFWGAVCHVVEYIGTASAQMYCRLWLHEAQLTADTREVPTCLACIVWQLADGRH